MERKEDIRAIWESAGAPVPLLMADEVAAMPPEQFERLRALGVLRPGELASVVGCDACDIDHLEWVESQAAPDGARRFFIDCPEKGRVEVPRERLQRWFVDFAPVAEAIRLALGATGELKTVRPGRAWRLGTARLGGSARELLMVRRSPRDGTPGAGPFLFAGEGTVVFVLGRGAVRRTAAAEPAGTFFDVPSIVGLDEFGLMVDRDAIERRLRPASPGGGRRAAQRRRLQLPPRVLLPRKAAAKRPAAVEQGVLAGMGATPS